MGCGDSLNPFDDDFLDFGGGEYLNPLTLPTAIGRDVGNFVSDLDFGGGGGGGGGGSSGGLEINFPDPPPPRDYAAEYQAIIDAQINNAGRIYNTEAEYRPQYAQLNVDIMEQLLPQLIDMNSDVRAGEIGDLERLGPRVTQAFRNANPQAASLLDEMTRQAGDEIELGTRLTPEEYRRAVQGARQGFNDRGMLMSDGAVFAEILNSDLHGRQRQGERRAFGDRMVMLNRSYYGDPLMTILGRPSSAFPSAQSVASGVPQVLNPESSYASALYGGNQDLAGAIYGQQYGAAYDARSTMFNAGVAQQIADRNNRYALYGAGISALGDIIGGLLPG